MQTECGGKKVMQCPFEGCGAEIIYTLKPEDLSRGAGVAKCPNCPGSVFVTIKVTATGIEIDGPKVLRLA